MQLRPKLLADWEELLKLETEQELREWIRGQGDRESLYLEFKREADTGSSTRENQVLKSICSFANSDGGILIIGINDHKHWSSQLINPQVENTCESIRASVLNRFIHIRPVYEIQWIAALCIIAICVRSSSREAVVMEQPNGYIGAFYRTKDGSQSYHRSDIQSIILGQRNQHIDLIDRYYKLMPSDMQYQNVTSGSKEKTSSSLLVSALPLTYLQPGNFGSQSMFDPTDLNSVPSYFKKADGHARGAIMAFQCTDSPPDESPSHYINVSFFDQGSYLLHISHIGGKFDRSKNLLMQAVGIYTIFAISSHLDDTKRWAIQGHLSSDVGVKSVIRNPVLFQSAESLRSIGPFHSIRSPSEISEETVLTFELIFDLLGADMQDALRLTTYSGNDERMRQATKNAIGLLLYSKAFMSL